MPWLPVSDISSPEIQISNFINVYNSGASSGIGAATAIHFAKLGYKLAICGRKEAALAETASHCLEANSSITPDDVHIYFVKTTKHYQQNNYNYYF